jgi:hypothetical protein
MLSLLFLNIIVKTIFSAGSDPGSSRCLFTLDLITKLTNILGKATRGGLTSLAGGKKLVELAPVTRMRRKAWRLLEEKI